MYGLLVKGFQRLLGELDGRSSPDWHADEASLDPAIYLDDERFAREQAQLFRRFPLCLGPADQLRELGYRVETAGSASSA